MPVRSLVRSLVQPLPRSLTGASAAASPLLTDLVAYWNLDESSGNRADSGPNGYTLTDNNTVGSATGVGAGQTAADFVAANSEYLSAGSGASPQIASECELATWVYVPTGSGLKTPVSWGGPTIWLDINYTNGVMTWRVRNSANTAFQALNSGTNVTLDAWNLVTAGISGGDYFLSVNAGTPTSAALTGGFLASPLAFEIGRRGAAQYWDDRIQAFGFWNRQLTAAERTYLYNSGTSARLYADLSGFTG